MKTKLVATSAALLIALAACSDTAEVAGKETTTAPEATQSIQSIDPAGADETTDREDSSNLPVKIGEKGDSQRLTLANETISISVPVDWESAQDPTEQIPIAYANSDTREFVGVSMVGPAALLPDPDDYAAQLESSLGLESGSVKYEGEVQLDGVAAHHYTTNAAGLQTDLYSFVVEKTAYELTLMSPDQVTESLRQVRDSIELKQ